MFVRAVLWSLPGAVLGFVFAEATLAAVRWGVSAGADQVASVAFGPAVVGAGLALTLIAGLATGASPRGRCGGATWLRPFGRGRRPRPAAGGATGDFRPGRPAGRRRDRVEHRRRTARPQHLERRVGGPGIRHRQGLDLEVRPAPVEVPYIFAGLRDYFWQALGRVRALPDVVSAGVSMSPPLTDTCVMLGGGMTVTTPAGRGRSTRLAASSCTPGYFESMGMRLVRGRFFSESRRTDEATVIVVDEAFCAPTWGAPDPLDSTPQFDLTSFRLSALSAMSSRRPNGIPTSAGRRSWVGNRLPAPPRTTRGARRRGASWSCALLGMAAGPLPPAVLELLLADNLAFLDDPRTFSPFFARRWQSVADAGRLAGSRNRAAHHRAQPGVGAVAVCGLAHARSRDSLCEIGASRAASCCSPRASWPLRWP